MLKRLALITSLVFASVAVMAQGRIDRNPGRPGEPGREPGREIGREPGRDREVSAEIIYGSEIRGNGTLYLRDELQRQNPRFDQSRFQVDRVILIAKSERSRGEAVMDFSGYGSETRLIDGDPRDFYSRDPRTFHAVEFFNSSRRSDGELMLHLNGHIMVDRVVLIGFMDRYHPEPPVRPDPRPRITYYDAGSERVQKFVETTKEFRTRQFDEAVLRIRITGTKERVRITRAVVEMQDGNQYELADLQAVVREGQEIGTFLNRAFVRRLIITAVSDNVTGSRGEYRVDFGVRE